MREFFEPTSVGLLIVCAGLAVAITGGTAVLWDRRGWIAVRFAGPLVSFVLLAIVSLIAINLSATLFATWSNVWGFLR